MMLTVVMHFHYSAGEDADRCSPHHNRNGDLFRVSMFIYFYVYNNMVEFSKLIGHMH